LIVIFGRRPEATRGTRKATQESDAPLLLRWVAPEKQTFVAFAALGGNRKELKKKEPKDLAEVVTNLLKK